MLNPVSKRQYSAKEVAAARRLGIADNKTGRGVIYFAGGKWWPDKLEVDAIKYEKAAADARLVAAALRREQEQW